MCLFTVRGGERTDFSTQRLVNVSNPNFLFSRDIRNSMRSKMEKLQNVIQRGGALVACLDVSIAEAGPQALIGSVIKEFTLENDASIANQFLAQFTLPNSLMGKSGLTTKTPGGPLSCPLLRHLLMYRS